MIAATRGRSCPPYRPLLDWIVGNGATALSLVVGVA